MKVSASTLQWIVILALGCFLAGFIVQISFHSMQFSKETAHAVLVPDQVPLSNGIVEANSRITASNHLPTSGGEALKLTIHSDSNKNYYYEESPPNIVRAWRQALIDWHSLIPKHNGLWERFGTPVKEGKLRLLVSKEMEVTNYLTRFHESGLATKYGYNHGMLTEYSGCNIFSSSCMIHEKRSCLLDQNCKWSADKSICIDGWENDSRNYEMDPITSKQCDNPYVIVDEGLARATNPTSQCKVWIHQPAVIFDIDSESQSMFYHWWASWSQITAYWKRKFNSRRDVHFFVKKINDPALFNFFGILSDNCWRRIGKTLNEGNCYCNIEENAIRQGSHGGDDNMLVNTLQLADVVPPKSVVKVGIISRRIKRFILNEYELYNKVIDMGFECVLLPLESMTLYEQIRELRSLDVLIGMHGSGLDNAVFLHPGSVLVQLLPYSVEYRCTFENSAVSAHVKYMEWQLKNQSLAVFHWDLLEQANKDKMQQQSKQAILNEGQPAASHRETLMFWINQDIIVPLHEWQGIVLGAAKQSNAPQRGIDVTGKPKSQ